VIRAGCVSSEELTEIGLGFALFDESLWATAEADCRCFEKANGTIGWTSEERG